MPSLVTHVLPHVGILDILEVLYLLEWYKLERIVTLPEVDSSLCKLGPELQCRGGRTHACMAHAADVVPL
jgi:hypothetical protein